MHAHIHLYLSFLAGVGSLCSLLHTIRHIYSTRFTYQLEREVKALAYQLEKGVKALAYQLEREVKALAYQLEREVKALACQLEREVKALAYLHCP